MQLKREQENIASSNAEKKKKKKNHNLFCHTLISTFFSAGSHKRLFSNWNTGRVIHKNKMSILIDNLIYNHNFVIQGIQLLH